MSVSSFLFLFLSSRYWFFISFIFWWNPLTLRKSQISVGGKIVETCQEWDDFAKVWRTCNEKRSKFKANLQQKQKKLAVRGHARGFGKVIWRKKQRPCYLQYKSRLSEWNGQKRTLMHKIYKKMLNVWWKRWANQWLDCRGHKAIPERMEINTW